MSNRGNAPRLAGDGYEFVPRGELIREGDEFWNGLKWKPTTRLGEMVGAAPYRRKTSGKAGGRLLRRPGDPVAYRVASVGNGIVHLVSTCGDVEWIIPPEEFNSMGFVLDDETPPQQPGNTSLLDQFAMSALNGLLASGYWQVKIADGALPIAQNAWKLARAMMETRGAHEG